MTIITPQLVVPLFAAFGVGGVVIMVAALLALAMLLVAFFGIETKERSLEELVPREFNSAAAAEPRMERLSH